jgi:DNA-binding Lrp family transcriptional regulator
MEDIKLDLKDRRILEALDRNSNHTLSGIAKGAFISKQVAEYRINKLLAQKTVYSFFVK